MRSILRALFPKDRRRRGRNAYPSNTDPTTRGLLKKPRPRHCEECGEVVQAVEHDEAIWIYALQMRARRLLRRHCLPTHPLIMTPRNDNSKVFQQSLESSKRLIDEIL